MKKIKNLLLILISALTFICFTSNVNALESNLVDDIEIKTGTVLINEKSQPYIKVLITLKNDVIINDESEFDLSAQNYEMHLPQLKILDSDASIEDLGREDYNVDNKIQGKTLKKGTRLYFYGLGKIDELFEFPTVNLYANLKEANGKTWMESYKYTLATDSLEVYSQRDYTLNADFYKALKEKYPDVSAIQGDPESMQFALILNSDPENYDFISLGWINFDSNKTVDSLLKEIEVLLKNIKTEVSDDFVVSSDLFKKIKTKGSTVIYEGNNNKDITNYIWTFDGTKLTDEDKNLNVKLGITIGNSKNKDKINSLINKATGDVLNLDFKHSGKLPNGTKVSIKVMDKFKDKDNLELYYYNPETNKLEKEITNIVVEDGFATFDLKHCSEYILAKADNVAATENKGETPENKDVTSTNKENSTEEKTTNPKTSSINIYLYAGITIVSLVGIVYIIKKRIA